MQQTEVSSTSEPTAEQKRIDRNNSIEWARMICNDRKAIILDTETTGLDSEAEVCQIGILSTTGRVLLDALIQPYGLMELEASRIHGITLDDLECPMFPAYYTAISEIFARASQIVIYNAAYDTNILCQTAESHNLLRIMTYANISCAMTVYAAFIGEWNDYHGNYRWHKLKGGDHSAIGDCRATLELIRMMADAKLEGE